jgi:hypothetical protein
MNTVITFRLPLLSRETVDILLKQYKFCINYVFMYVSHYVWLHGENQKANRCFLYILEISLWRYL